MEIKTTVCKCGETVVVPFENGEYLVCQVKCPRCKRHSTGGNYKTGEVDSWITQQDLNRANREYQQRCFEADNNEFYGRGNW